MIEIHKAKIDFGNAIIDAEFSKRGGFLAGTIYADQFTGLPQLKWSKPELTKGK